MEIIRDIILVNREVSRKTVSSFKKNWILIFTGIVYMILNIFIFNILRVLLAGPISIFSGIIVLIINSALISNYLYLLHNIIYYNRVTITNFKDGFFYYLRKIYGIFFIAWVVDLALSFITGIVGSGYFNINRIVNISMFIFLNALPETVYLKNLDSAESVSYALEFMKDNWINWLIPNAVFIIILWPLTGRVFGQIFTTYVNTGSIIKGALAQVIFTIAMIYRGHLYKILSTGNRRKRMFMNQF